MVTPAEVRAMREGIASYVLATADYGRRDRLWPAHYLVFGTNPLSVAYGASGIALFLHEALGELPAEVRTWMLSHPVTVEEYPPGLFVGMAGIAHAFHQVGLEERAEEIMETCYRSPLRFADTTLFLGAAGWGLASLWFHARTGRQRYLDAADQAVDYLLREAKPEGEGCYWHRSDEETVNHGYGYGASGIAHFLLQAGLALGRGDAVRAARRGLEFEIATRVEVLHGWTWPDRRGGNLALPYWGHGSSGVGATAIRFYEALGEERYRELAETIADGAFCRWSVLPSLVEGLSGIAEYMVDLYRATGRDLHRERAWTMADTLTWYTIERPDGITFPGRWLMKVSNDYATGSAGIGLFLGRLLSPGRPRSLVDLSNRAAGEALPWHEAAPPAATGADLLVPA